MFKGTWKIQISCVRSAHITSNINVDKTPAISLLKAKKNTCIFKKCFVIFQWEKILLRKKIHLGCKKRQCYNWLLLLETFYMPMWLDMIMTSFPYWCHLLHRQAEVAYLFLCFWIFFYPPQQNSAVCHDILVFFYSTLFPLFFSM